jgi:hypothetical protein
VIYPKTSHARGGNVAPHNVALVLGVPGDRAISPLFTLHPTQTVRYWFTFYKNIEQVERQNTAYNFAGACFIGANLGRFSGGLLFIDQGFLWTPAGVSNPVQTASDWSQYCLGSTSQCGNVTSVSPLRNRPTPSNNYASFPPVFFCSQFQYCEGEPL